MLSQKQKKAIDEPLSKFNIFSGVTGSGKSLITNLILIKYLLSDAVKDGDLILFSGNTSESLYDNVVKPIIQVDPVGLFTYSNKAGHQRLYYNDGSKRVEVSCVGANNERAQDRVQGKNVALWLADEIVKQPQSFVEMALSRCRRVTNGEMETTPVVWTCNPDHPDHFIKKNYIDNDKVDCKNWFFGFLDNPAIGEEYIKDVKQRYSGVFYQRMIEGKWVAAEGGVFTNFDPSFHVVDEHPEIREYYLSCDWGFNNPMSLLLIGEDADGCYYVLEEFYQSGRLVDESVNRELRDRGWDKLGSRNDMPYQCMYDVESPSDAQRMRDMGWNMVPALKHPGSVVESIKATQQAFQKQDNGKARLYIMRNCHKTIGEISGYRWKTVRGVNKDEPVKENDHAVDAVKQFVYTKDAGRVRVLKKTAFR